jgi:hypothetical protein
MSPNVPKTPVRGFRIPDDPYFPAKEKAAREGTTVSEVVRVKLSEWVEESDE